VQEIFGINAHIRSVADRYAEAGYLAVAPALFDRAERGQELEYRNEDVARGRELRQRISLDDMVADVAASISHAARAGKVAVIGYCLGGSLAWLAAARVPGLAAAVGYYGGMIAGHLDEAPACPVLLHFGESDPSILMADVARIRAAVDPEKVQVFTYAAGHAFNRDGTAAYHEESARVALERTMALLAKTVG
jgi:carboxymethylenebutenolidase